MKNEKSICTVENLITSLLCMGKSYKDFPFYFRDNNKKIRKVSFSFSVVPDFEYNGRTQKEIEFAFENFPLGKGIYLKEIQGENE